MTTEVEHPCPTTSITTTTTNNNNTTTTDKQQQQQQPARIVNHKNIPCKYYFTSSCIHGDNCPYSHLLPYHNYHNNHHHHHHHHSYHHQQYYGNGNGNHPGDDRRDSPTVSGDLAPKRHLQREPHYYYGGANKSYQHPHPQQLYYNNYNNDRRAVNHYSDRRGSSSSNHRYQQQQQQQRHHRHTTSYHQSSYNNNSSSSSIHCNKDENDRVVLLEENESNNIEVVGVGVEETVASSSSSIVESASLTSSHEAEGKESTVAAAEEAAVDVEENEKIEYGDGEETTASGVRIHRICRFFAFGQPCKYGTYCRFAHSWPDPSDSSVQVQLPPMTTFLNDQARYYAAAAAAAAGYYYTTAVDSTTTTTTTTTTATAAAASNARYYATPAAAAAYYPATYGTAAAYYSTSTHASSSSSYAATYYGGNYRGYDPVVEYSAQHNNETAVDNKDDVDVTAMTAEFREEEEEQHYSHHQRRSIVRKRVSGDTRHPRSRERFTSNSHQQYNNNAVPSMFDSDDSAGSTDREEERRSSKQRFRRRSSPPTSDGDDHCETTVKNSVAKSSEKCGSSSSVCGVAQLDSALATVRPLLLNNGEVEGSSIEPAAIAHKSYASAVASKSDAVKCKHDELMQVLEQLKVSHPLLSPTMWVKAERVCSQVASTLRGDNYGIDVKSAEPCVTNKPGATNRNKYHIVVKVTYVDNGITDASVLPEQIAGIRIVGEKLSRPTLEVVATEQSTTTTTTTTNGTVVAPHATEKEHAEEVAVPVVAATEPVQKDTIKKSSTYADLVKKSIVHPSSA